MSGYRGRVLICFLNGDVIINGVADLEEPAETGRPPWTGVVRDASGPVPPSVPPLGMDVLVELRDVEGYPQVRGQLVGAEFPNGDTDKLPTQMNLVGLVPLPPLAP